MYEVSSSKLYSFVRLRTQMTMRYGAGLVQREKKYWENQACGSNVGLLVLYTK